MQSLNVIGSGADNHAPSPQHPQTTFKKLDHRHARKCVLGEINTLYTLNLQDFDATERALLQSLCHKTHLQAAFNRFSVGMVLRNGVLVPEISPSQIDNMLTTADQMRQTLVSLAVLRLAALEPTIHKAFYQLDTLKTQIKDQRLAVA